MIVEFIELQNIRSYVHGRVEFPKGKVLLWGDIGAGKSTLLHSLEYALFGNLSNMDLNGLIRKGEKRGRIKVGLEIGGKKVVIERVIEIKSNKAVGEECYLTLNGYRERLTPTLMKAKIYKLLGYPESFINKRKNLPFNYSVYVPQEKMKEIIFASKEERLSVLRKLFNVEKYEIVIGNVQEGLKGRLREVISHYEGKIENLKVHLSREEELKEMLRSKEEEVRKISKVLEEYKKEVEAYNSAVENKNKILEEILHKEREEREIKELRSSYEKEIESMNNQLTHLINLSSFKEKYLENDILYVKEMIESEERKLNDALKDITRCVGELNVKKMELERKKKELLDKRERKSVLEKEKEGLEKRIEDDKSKLKHLEGMIQVLSEEERKIMERWDNLKKEIEEKENAIQSIDKEINSLISEISSKEGGLNEKKRELEKLSSLDVCPMCKQKIDSSHLSLIQDELKQHEIKIQQEVNVMKEKMTKLSTQKEKLQKEIAELRQLQDRAYYIKEKASKNQIIEKEIEDIKKRIAINEEKLGDILKRLNEFPDTTQEIEIVERDLKDVESSIQEHVMRKNEIEIKLSNLLKEKEISSRISHLKESIKNKKKEFEEKKKDWEERLNILHAILSDLKDKVEKYTRVIEEKRGAVEKYNELFTKESEIRGEISSIKRSLEEMHALKNELQEYEHKVRVYKEVLRFLDQAFVPLVKEMERVIMYRIRNEFNKLFKEYVVGLLEDVDFSVYINEDFYPVVTMKNYEMSYDYLSGGERQSIALSYRLALNKIINTLLGNISTKDLLILDEPTDGFSVQQIESMRTLLNNLNVKQIIIVSHESIMQDIVDHVIRINKVGGKSKVEVYE